MFSKKYIIILFSILVLLAQSACGPFKYKKVSAKDVPPNVRDRVKKNMEEGKGFRLMNQMKKGTNYEFASSNPLWRATLDTLDFMPLALANYSGGVIVTDWYNDDETNNESIKISIRFLSNEIRSDALVVKVFYKNCSTQQNCKISDRSSMLSKELTKKILNKAAVYEAEMKSKKKNTKYINKALEQ